MTIANQFFLTYLSKGQEYTGQDKGGEVGVGDIFNSLGLYLNDAILIKVNANF